MSLRLSWDERQALANLCKCGVNVAASVNTCGDPNCVTLSDELHSTAEDRVNVIGLSDTG
jgi:uncharacterized DUF497 family protein